MAASVLILILYNKKTPTGKIQLEFKIKSGELSGATVVAAYSPIPSARDGSSTIGEAELTSHGSGWDIINKAQLTYVN